MAIQIQVDQLTLAYLESNKGVLQVGEFATLLLEGLVRDKTNLSTSQQQEGEGFGPDIN